MKEGTLWRQKKIRKSAEKITMGGYPLGTSGCVCFLEKVKNERGAFGLSLQVCLGRTWP